MFIAALFIGAIPNLAKPVAFSNKRGIPSGC
jgi:hypothetical protein